jgi:hypothetical protein
MDIAFGTFKSSFNEDHLDTCGPKAREDAKSTLFLVPTQEFVTYLAGSSLCIIPWAYYSLQNYQLSTYSALIISSLVGVGPSILSVIVSNAYKRTNATHPIKMSVVGNILHIAVGLLLCAVPLTYGCYLVLS